MPSTYPTWHQFYSVNAEAPNSAFEHLCRLLFTAELSIEAPPQQRKNQAGIETEPVEHNGELVGFQAKHYDNRINKADVIDSINTAKERHPMLTVLYFYCNLEFGNPQKGQDITLTEAKIKACANKNGLRLVLRMGTQILDLVAKNALAYKYFFDPLQAYKKLLAHEKNQQDAFFLYAQNGLHASDLQFHLERPELESSIAAAIESDSLIIIHGESGTGKSAVVRTVAEKCHNNTVFCYRRGQYMQSSRASTLIYYGKTDWTLEDFDNAHNVEFANCTKCLVIDSAEHILHSAGLYGILNELAQLICKGWKILFTIRTENLVALLNILRDAQYPPSVLIEVPEISEENVNSILSTFGRKPQYQKDLSFYKNLFYLSLFLKSGDTTSTTDIALNVIKGKYGEALATQRIQAFETYVEQVCKRSSHIVKTRFIEPVGFASLKSDGILITLDNDTFCTAAHDQFLDWGIERIMHEVWEEERDISGFLDKIPKFAKGYNLTSWLKKKISSDRTFAIRICEIIINPNKITEVYITDITSALLQSDYFPSFIENYKNDILENDARVLLLLSKTINSTCKYKIPDKDSLMPLFHYQGACWGHLLMFVLKEYQNIDKYALKEIIEGLFLFTLVIRDSSIYQSFFRFAWHCFKANPYSLKNVLSICEILISYAPNVIVDELHDIKDDDSPDWVNALYKQIMFHTSGYRRIANSIHEHILSKFIPKWLDHDVLPEHSNAWYGSDHGLIDPLYGNIEYFPSSAYQTPFYWLLKENPEKALSCYITCIEKMQAYLVENSPYDTIEKIPMYISETEYIKISASSSLWGAYRGTESPTHSCVLHSMLMALEKYLLEDFHNSSENINQKETFLINLLGTSKAVCVAGVISSLVLAYPDVYKRTATILCKTVHFLEYDFDRFYNENQASSCNTSMLNDANKEQFYKERKTSNSLEHRKSNLAYLSFYLQSNYIEAAQLIQESYDAYHTAHKNQPAFFNTRLILYTHDPRYLRKEIKSHSAGYVQVSYSIDPIKLPKNIQDYFLREDPLKKNRQKLLDLKMWCMGARGLYSSGDQLRYWDEHPMEVFRLAQDIEKHPKLYQQDEIAIPTFGEVVAAIYLKSRDKLPSEHLIELSDIVLNHLFPSRNSSPFSEQTDLLMILPSIVRDIEECRAKALHLLKIKFCELCNQKYSTHEIFAFCDKIHELDLWSLFPAELQQIWNSAYVTLTEENLLPINKLQNLEFLFYLLFNKESRAHNSHNVTRIFEDINKYSTLVINSGRRDFTLHSEFCMRLGKYLICLAPDIIEAKINCIAPLIINNTCSGKQLLHSILVASKASDSTEAFWRIWNHVYAKFTNSANADKYNLIDTLILDDRFFASIIDLSHIINERFYLFFEKLVNERVISQQRVFEATVFIFSIHYNKISLHTYDLLSKIIDGIPRMNHDERTIYQLERLIENTHLDLSKKEQKQLHAHMHKILILMRDNGSNYAHTKLEQGF